MIFAWPDAINGLVELAGTTAVLLREKDMTRWEYFKWAFLGNDEDGIYGRAGGPHTLYGAWLFWWRNPAHNWCYHGGGRVENGWFICYPSAGPEDGKLWCYLGHRPFSMKRTADGGLESWPGAFGCKPPRWETITPEEARPMREAIAKLRAARRK